MPRMPWDYDGPRPNTPELFFWIAVVAAGSGFVAITHWRDTSHGGDNWDWFDWIEATVSSLAAGLVVVGVIWIVGSAIAERLGASRERSS